MNFGLFGYQSGGRLLGVMRPDGTWEPGQAPSRRHGYYEPEIMPEIGPAHPVETPRVTGSIQNAIRGADEWLRERTGMGLMTGRPEVPDVIRNPLEAAREQAQNWIDEHIIGNTLRAVYVVFGVILIAVALTIMSKNQ